MLHLIDDESKVERERHDKSVDNVMSIVLPVWRKCKNISVRISRTGAGANIVCLAAESASSIDGEFVVKTR